MQIILVENDPLIAEDLVDKLNDLGYAKPKIADNVEDAIELLKTENADLFLVDIELNGERDGIDLGKILNSNNVKFIYLSEVQDSATFNRAKATNPESNLPKPISLLQLRNALLEIDFDEDAKFETSDAFMVTHGGKRLKIDKSDVIYLAAARNNCDIFTAEGRFVSSTPMSNVIRILNTNTIVQVHRSYAINTDKLQSIQGNMIQLKGIDATLPISNKYRDNITGNYKLV